MAEQNDGFELRRAKRRKKLRRRRIRRIIVFFLALAVAVFSILSVTVLFPVESIKAYGSSVYSPEQIVKASKLTKKNNLIRISRSKLEATIRSSLPFTDTVEIKRVFPNTLEIKVSDAAEFVCYYYDGAYYTVSKKEYVLKSYAEAPNDLCEIRCKSAKCKVGSKISITDTDEKEICDTLLELLIKLNVTVNSLDTTDKLAIKARVNEKFEVTFGSKSYTEEKSKHLAAMLKNIDSQNGGTINLSMWTPDNKEGTFIENTE